MLAFAYPWLLALAVLPLLLRWALPPYRQTRVGVTVPFLDRVAALTGQQPATGAVELRPPLVQQVAVWAVWLCVVAALARPQWLEQPVTKTVPTRDLLLAVDLSGSMETKDFTDASGKQVDRLTAVKHVIAQHDLALFAMRPGTYDIPPFTVRLASADAPGEQPVEHRLTTPPLRIEARLPPGAEHVPSLISTSALTVSEQWKPEPKEARVGDAFTRTVTRSAPDVPAMAFPPLPVTDLDGMAAYPKPPVVQDHSERGTFTGTRIDSVTYVCERPGTVTVPALEFPWWNVRTQTMEMVTLPAVTLDVGHAPPSQSTRNRLDAAIVAVALLAALALWWWWDALRAARRRRRGQYEASEAGCFARLERACLDGDAPAAYRALFAWLERAHPRGRPATIQDDLLAGRTDAELRARVEELEAAVVAGQKRWDGAALAAALRRARSRRGDEPLAAALPALNPG